MIQLNYRDSRPIYEQVKDGLRHLVVTGALLPGEQFPSVRAMASQLAINPNTIKRAYEALEREGYLYTVAGKGCFVAEQEEGVNPRAEQLLSQLDELAGELAFLGVAPEDLSRRVRQVADKALQELQTEKLGEKRGTEA